MSTTITITVATSGGTSPATAVHIPSQTTAQLTSKAARKEELKGSAHKVLKASQPVLKTGIYIAAHVGAGALIASSHGTLAPIIEAAVICGAIHEVSEVAAETVCCLTEVSVDRSIDCSVDHDCC